MIPVSGKIKAAFQSDSMLKTYYLQFPQTEDKEYKQIDNTGLASDSITLTEPMCSEEQLKYGRCEAATFECEVAYEAESLKGRIFNLYLVLGEYTEQEDIFTVGRYVIDEEEIENERMTKSITAYDIMYTLLKLDITAFIFSINFPISVKDFRDALFEYIGQEQVDVNLPNDNLILQTNPFDNTDINFETVITGLCEVNARFGHINREGKFDYVGLTPPATEEVYPASDLYPSSTLYPNSIRSKAYYISPSLTKSDIAWQNYMCKTVDTVQVRNQAGSVVLEYHLPDKNTYTNIYVIQNNWVVNALDSGGVQAMTYNFANAIAKVTYRPCDANVKMDLSYEVGDPIVLTGTDGTKIHTYIFNRTMTGISSAFDEFEATGYEEWVNEPPDSDGAVQELADDLSDLTDRVEALEQGTAEGGISILSVTSLPTSPKKNVLYLVQGKVTVV